MLSNTYITIHPQKIIERILATNPPPGSAVGMNEIYLGGVAQPHLNGTEIVT